MFHIGLPTPYEVISLRLQNSVHKCIITSKINVSTQLHFYRKIENYSETFNLYIVQSTLCKICSPLQVQPKVTWEKQRFPSLCNQIFGRTDKKFIIKKMYIKVVFVIWKVVHVPFVPLHCSLTF